MNNFVDVTMKRLSRNEIAVWFVLFRDCRDGIARTSQTDIANRAGASTRTVRRVIKKLEQLGLLKIVYHGGLPRRLSKYWVLPLAEMRLPFISRIHFIECSANYPQEKDVTVQHTHGKVSCSEWTGVPLSILLNEAGVKSGASWIVAEGADRDFHSKSIPLVRAMDSCYVAYGQNGEPLRPHQGFPIRLMVPGAGGFSHVKWLQRIKLVDKPYMTPSERFQLQFGAKSVITYPSGGQQVPGPGFYSIRGLAWSGGGAIRSVEVSTDGGRNWNPAQVVGPALPMAHTLFRYDWNWNGREAVIMSRCTDETGQTQLNVADYARSQGVSNDRVISGEVEPSGQWPFVFPWRVASDGSVRHNFWV